MVLTSFRVRTRTTTCCCQRTDDLRFPERTLLLLLFLCRTQVNFRMKRTKINIKYLIIADGDLPIEIYLLLPALKKYLLKNTYLLKRYPRFVEQIFYFFWCDVSLLRERNTCCSLSKHQLLLKLKTIFIFIICFIFYSDFAT